MISQLKNFNFPAPDGFTLKFFIHKHGFVVRCIAFV